MVLSVMNVEEVMNARKSVRNYDIRRKIPNETILNMIKLATTAPSSWNLQHWKFIIISNSDVKETLLQLAYYQEQVINCSHLILVLGDTKAYRNAEEILTEQVKKGFMSAEAKDAQIESIMYAYKANKEKYGVHDAIRNGSLAAMQLMLAAKHFGVDSCPMLSFKEKEIMKVLNVPGHYLPVMMISLGYAAKPAYETIRFPLERVILGEL